MGLLGRALEALTGEKAGDKSVEDTMASIDAVKGEKELASKIRSDVESISASTSRMAHQGIWMQNCAYVLGFAGVYWNSQQRQFVPINRASAGLKRDRLYVNKLLPNLQNRLARLVKNPPRYDVRPEDSTQNAKDDARFKLDILNAKWDELQINLKRIPLLMWVQQCGHAYLVVEWDDTKGRFITDPMTGEGDFEGDVRVDVASAFEFFPDPLARTIEEAQYLIRAKVRPIEYFRSRYGEKGKEVKSEDTWLLSSQYEARINTFNVRGPSAGDDMQKNTAIELCRYERPSREHPRGRMTIVANGVVLKDGELPTGEIPVVKFDDIAVGGKYYSESVVTHCRPIQDQYNKTIQRRADWVNKLLAGKYVSPRGNELIRESITDLNAEIIQYTPVPNAPNGGEPRAMDIPMIPSYAYNEEERLDSMFGEIMGINEVSKGTLPSASIPAIGMQLLVEQDDTRIGVEVMQHEASYAKLGKLILDFIQKYYITPRRMKFAGKQSYVVKDISGEDIKGDNDVIVIPGSTIPGSKTLRRQEILNAYGQGLLGDPQDPKVRQNVLGWLELGDVGEMWLDHAITEQRMQREIETIKAGEMPDIDEMDNHTLHIQELNRLRHSELYDQLTPQSQNILLAVREERLRLLMEQTGASPPSNPDDIATDQALAEQAAMTEGQLTGEVAPMATETLETTETTAPIGGL